MLDLVEFNASLIVYKKAEAKAKLAATQTRQLVGDVIRGVGEFTFKASRGTAHFAGHLLTRTPGEYFKEKVAELLIDNRFSRAVIADNAVRAINRSERATSFVLHSRQLRLEAQKRGTHPGCCCLGCVTEIGLVGVDTTLPIGLSIATFIFPPAGLAAGALTWIGFGDLLSLGEAAFARATDGRALDKNARKLRVILALTPIVPSRVVLPFAVEARKIIEDKLAEKNGLR